MFANKEYLRKLNLRSQRERRFAMKPENKHANLNLNKKFYHIENTSSKTYCFKNSKNRYNEKFRDWTAI